MQIIVLGMHRSGTSIVARLLNMMGVYFGPEGAAIDPQDDNSKGFWERRDVLDTNNKLLRDNGLNWDRVLEFEPSRCTEKSLAEFELSASKIVRDMDSHRPWFIKEPRLCVLFGLWRKYFEVPVCLYVFRSPVEVAKSLHARNAIPVSAGIGLWELYNKAALKAAHGLPSLCLSHSELMVDPVAVVNTLYENLLTHGVQGIRKPSASEIEAFISIDLYHQRTRSNQLPEYLTSTQLEFLSAIEAGLPLSDELSMDISLGARTALAEYEADFKRDAEARQAIDSLVNKNEKLLAKVEYHTAELSKLSADKASLESTLTNKVGLLENSLASLNGEKQYLQEKMLKEKESLREALEKEKALREGVTEDFYKKVAYLNKQLLRVDSLVSQIAGGVTALLNSRRWRLGDAILSVKQKILLRKRPHLVSDYLVDRLQEYASWKDAVGDTVFEDQVPISDTQGAYKIPSVDIVVCVHNALEDVKKCIQSIIDCTMVSYSLIIVNDGSEDETSVYLEEIAETYSFVTLFKNSVALGYTKAANIGLKHATADYVVCLNSDTVVSRLWVNRLVACGESDERIGIVGPLSNAASWQSVPKRFGENGDWAINDLPDGFSVDNMATLVACLSQREYPRVPFVNGFCFAIKRSLIEKIGYLDEEAFPQGYGEENDYCMRAINAGFVLSVADDAYVFHAKSKSFTHERRLLLAKAGDESLRKKHGDARVKSLVKDIQNNEALAAIQLKVEAFSKDSEIEITPSSLKICFYLPAGGVSGGIHSIVQEVVEMRRLGVDAKVAIPAKFEANYATHFSSYYKAGECFLFYPDETYFESYAKKLNLLIATTFNSPKRLENFFAENKQVLPAYYVQDHETLFFSEGSEGWGIARESYSLVPRMTLFAKTDWICQEISSAYGVGIRKVSPSLDRDTFFPRDSKIQSDTVSIIAMLRPETPRRGPDRTVRVARQIKECFKDKVRLCFFGSNDAELERVGIDFECENHGVLTKEAVANLYRSGDIFIDLSDYQAFGRTGLEAMACGLAVVQTDNGGVYEYSKPGENCQLVDVRNEDLIVSTLKTLVLDSELRSRLARSGLMTAANFTLAKAALSQIALFTEVIEEQEYESAKLKDQLSKVKKTTLNLFYARRGDGQPAGSTHIRLLQPLSHSSVRGHFTIKHCALEDIPRIESGHVVVQRNAISDVATARLLVEQCVKCNLKLILEIDDDLINLHKKPGKDVSLPRGTIKALKIIATSADRVVVSSPPLAKIMGQFNDDVVVVPNAHDESIWLEKTPAASYRLPVPKEEGVVRFVYMGTRTHARDLLLIERAWKRIAAEYKDRVSLDVIGGAPEGVIGFGEELKPGKIGAHSDSYEEFVEWFRFVNRWHVGLIPLELTDFNRSKSFIKYLDYSAIGVPSICTDIEPYRAVVKDGINGLLVSNDEESWYLAMKSLIDNESLRSQLAKQAFRSVASNHILEFKAYDFLQAYSLS